MGILFFSLPQNGIRSAVKTTSPIVIGIGLIILIVHLVILFVVLKYSSKPLSPVVTHLEPIRTYILNTALKSQNIVEPSRQSPSATLTVPYKKPNLPSQTQLRSNFQIKSQLKPKFNPNQQPNYKTPAQPAEPANHTQPVFEKSAFEKSIHEKKTIRDYLLNDNYDSADEASFQHNTNATGSFSSAATSSYLPANANPNQLSSINADINHLDCQAIAPVYPLLSRRRGESGLVTIEMIVSPQGRVEQARIKISSGFEALDQAALKAAQASQCRPYMLNGEAVRAITDRPYHFALSK